MSDTFSYTITGHNVYDENIDGSNNTNIWMPVPSQKNEWVFRDKVETADLSHFFICVQAYPKHNEIME